MINRMRRENDERNGNMLQMWCCGSRCINAQTFCWVERQSVTEQSDWTENKVLEDIVESTSLLGQKIVFQVDEKKKEISSCDLEHGPPTKKKKKKNNKVPTFLVNFYFK